MAQAIVVQPSGPGLQDYLNSKIEELDLAVRDKALNLKRLEAQRNVLNSQGMASSDGKVETNELSQSETEHASSCLQ